MQLFAFDDDYSFGIIQSLPHLAWYRAKAARLKNEEDYNYSAESVYDTFPWPQFPDAKQVDLIAECGKDIRRIRAEALAKKVKGGLRGLYHSLVLPGKSPLKDAHANLDAAVYAAYKFSSKKDVLKQLLELNETIAGALFKNNDVTGPGVPSTYPNVERLRSDDSLGQ